MSEGPGGTVQRQAEAAEGVIKVSALREGTVIDHLVGGSALKVLSVLGMRFEGAVTLGLNLDSRKAGRKDIIKIERRELTPAEVARIALISPRATFSIIRDFKVVRKFTPELPTLVEGLIRCPNPSCISNANWVTSKFSVLRADPLRVRCHYCERSLKKEEIELL